MCMRFNRFLVVRTRLKGPPWNAVHIKTPHRFILVILICMTPSRCINKNIVCRDINCLHALWRKSHFAEIQNIQSHGYLSTKIEQIVRDADWKQVWAHLKSQFYSHFGLVYISHILFFVLFKSNRTLDILTFNKNTIFSIECYEENNCFRSQTILTADCTLWVIRWDTDIADCRCVAEQIHSLNENSLKLNSQEETVHLG